ncbi:MAG: PTS sugar transporter subunit IIA [bacterium]
MAVKLSLLLKPELILLDMKQTQRTEGIHEVANLLANHPDISNFQSFYEELLARERVESTCLGNEVAFPHARTDHVSGMILAVGRSKEGVWFENCNQRVKFLFVIGTPKKMVTDYLAMIGSLARILRDDAIRESLLNAPTVEEFRAILLKTEK